MKILFTLGALRIGGYEILALQIASALVERKNEVAILSLSKLDEMSDRVGKDVKIYFAPRYLKYDLTIFIRILKVLRNFRPDIIMAGAFLDYFLVKFASLFCIKRPKFILSFHLTTPYDQREDRFNKIYTSLARIFDDRYIAIHGSQIDFYHYYYGLPKDRFSLITNGVDVNHYRPLEENKVQEGELFRIVQVANLKPLKDQRTLLMAMRELNKRYKKWELRIAGSDQSGLLPMYEDFIRRYNLGKNVKFLGPVDDVREILNSSDVFVLTSVTESLPLSLLEALAMGLPCVVTDVGGNKNLIENGKDGFLINPGDYKAISRYLSYLIKNPQKRKEMGNRARDKVVRKFNSEVMLKKYFRLFDEVLKDEF